VDAVNQIIVAEWFWQVANNTETEGLGSRHSTGFKLANQGVDTRSLQHYLGHKNIQHTVRYSELSPDRFRDFWKD
jgi:site-specific recombinase XerD